jgi:hypothetical protein
MKRTSVLLIALVSIALITFVSTVQAQINDLNGILTVTSALDAQAITSTTNGPSIATTGYVGGVVFVVNAKLDSGSTATLNIKLQTTGNDSTFADVTGKTFAEITTVTTCAKIGIRASRLGKWTRLVYTKAGDYNYKVAAAMLGQKRY